MIQPLRKLHRRMFLALLLILPVLFVSGLLSRHEWPSAGLSLAKGPIRTDKIVSPRTAVLAGNEFDVRILDEGSGTSGWSLELVPHSPLVAPDVLVYWSKASAASELPAGAELIGAFELNRVYRLPMQKMQDGHGFIVLYSLAQKQTLGSFAIGPVGSRP
jgi:hypothetical protein